MILGRKAVFLLFLLLLSSVVNAELLATVSPKDPNVSVMSLYLDESADFEVTVLNDGPDLVEGVMVKMSVSDGLKIIDGGVEKTTVSHEIDSINSTEKEILLVKVKPTELSSNKLFLYVDYGEHDYTHLSATFLNVSESPLLIETNLSKTALDMGEEAFVALSLKNTSSEPITDITAELIVFSGLESMNGDIYLASLAPGEGYEAKEFVFRADPEVTGEKPVVLQISFEDKAGKHVVEKNFAVEIQSKQTIIYLIVAVIVLLIVVAFLSRRGESKPIKTLEKPIVKELEGKSL